MTDADRAAIIDDALERLELVDEAGGATRLETLERIHAALEEELEADEAPAAGR